MPVSEFAHQTATDQRLVEHRLKDVEHVNEKQQAAISTLEKKAANLEGQQAEQARASNSWGKFIGPLISALMLIIVSFIGKDVIGRIDKVSEKVTNLSESAVDREARVRQAEKSVDDLSGRTRELELIIQKQFTGIAR